MSQTEAIFAPVIADLKKWRESVSPALTDVERQLCQHVIDNIDMPRAAWENPERHLLYRSAISGNMNSLTFGVFYCSRLVYVDYYHTLYNTLRHLRPGNEPSLFESQKVRERFVRGSLVEAIRSQYGEEVLSAAPGRVAELYSHHRSQEQTLFQKTEAPERGKSLGELSNSHDTVCDGLESPRRSKRKAPMVHYQGMDPSAGDNVYSGLGLGDESEAMSGNSAPNSLHDIPLWQGRKVTLDMGTFIRVPKRKKPETAYENDSSQTSPRLGMTLSDAELLEHVEKELRQCGVWDELEKLVTSRE